MTVPNLNKIRLMRKEERRSNGGGRRSSRTYNRQEISGLPRPQFRQSVKASLCSIDGPMERGSLAGRAAASQLEELTAFYEGSNISAFHRFALGILRAFRHERYMTIKHTSEWANESPFASIRSVPTPKGNSEIPEYIMTFFAEYPHSLYPYPNSTVSASNSLRLYWAVFFHVDQTPIKLLTVPARPTMPSSRFA